MQTTALEIPSPSFIARFFRNLAWFLIVPTLFLIATAIGAGFVVTNYQNQHQDRIFTGVSAWGVDLSGMKRSEARAALTAQFPYATQDAIELVDRQTGERWVKMPAELGLSIDLDPTINEAFQIGRTNNTEPNYRQQFETWYYGHQIAPVILFNEAKVDAFVIEVANAINTPPINASLDFDGNQAGYSTSQTGRILDSGAVREQILTGMRNMQQVNMVLPVLEIQPDVVDTSNAASAIRQIIEAPITFYLNEPLADTDIDLSQAIISTQQLTSWLRIDPITNADGSLGHHVYVDENAVRNWLIEYENKLYRQPVNARFYFNDDTRELVLVETHINGRTLDVDATLAKFMAHVENPNRSIAFVMKDIVPTVHAGATAAELGITELVTENTTWFRGSTVERKHNIARAASNFYGIVVAPGESFSFNNYLGNISLEDGYETGLIIIGGRTIEGVGGGVCQVSTTIFQSAFWAGFPIEERWAHGYQVGYYNDGEGAGMDATIFNPVVDFRFTNNTPHHLLIENYYNEANESLTFKFYSTNMNRQVVKGNVNISNVVPPNPDVWEFNPDLPEGEIEQVDWAVEGSTVRITREVFNENGDTLYGQETYESNYIPWQNVYQYGPGVNVPNSSSAPVQAGDG